MATVLAGTFLVNQNERLGAVVDNYRKHFGEKAHVVIDAGTRDGEDANYLAQALQAERVIAIDANPIAIKKTRDKFPQFEIIETALADYTGHTSFDQILSDREDLAGSSSLTRGRTFHDATHNQITVRVDTMQNVLARIDLTGLIDVIKVDLEGYTYQFIEGLGRRLADVKLLHLETETFHRHQGHRNNKEVIALMTWHGFELVNTSYEWGPTIEDQVWVNTRLALD